jgi:hypothetical protein
MINDRTVKTRSKSLTLSIDKYSPNRNFSKLLRLRR